VRKPDRICGTADDEALGALGWGAGFCPNLDRGDCNELITVAGDIAPRLASIRELSTGDADVQGPGRVRWVAREAGRHKGPDDDRLKVHCLPAS